MLKDQDSWKAYRRLRQLSLATQTLFSTNQPLCCSTKITLFNPGHSSSPCRQGKRTYFLTINFSVGKKLSLFWLETLYWLSISEEIFRGLVFLRWEEEGRKKGWRERKRPTTIRIIKMIGMLQSSWKQKYRLKYTITTKILLNIHFFSPRNF